EHLEATPDAGPGLVVRQQPRGRAVLVEDLGGLVGLEAVGPLTGDAATTLDRRADVLGPALGVLDPGEDRQRRPMPNVTTVAAVEQRDPVAVLVLREGQDSSGDHSAIL